MSQSLQKDGVPLNSQVFLSDGTTVNVGLDGIITAVPDKCVGPLLADGWVIAGGTQLMVAISPFQIRLPTGNVITATEAAGGFNLSVASEVIKLQGEVTDNETEVSVGYAIFQLPNTYVAGTDFLVRVPCAIIATAAAVNNGSTVDLEARVQANGAVGSDLCITAAQTFAALDTWYTKNFTIAGVGVLPGSTIILKLTTSIVDSEAGGGTLRYNGDTMRITGSVRV